jgi:hypothetical protein
MSDPVGRKEISPFDAIEYLSQRMFPAKLVNKARIDVGEGKSRENAEAYTEIVRIYERTLRALSDDSLMAMVEDERQQDAALQQEREVHLDRCRFFNDPKAAANFARWAKRPCWTLDEATALILGKNPANRRLGAHRAAYRHFSVGGPFCRYPSSFDACSRKRPTIRSGQSGLFPDLGARTRRCSAGGA